MQEQHKEAIRMLDKYRQFADLPHSRSSEELKRSLEKLEDMFEQQKNPRSIEDHIKQIQGIIANLRNDEMSYSERDDLKDRCDDMRMALRKLY